MSDKEEFNVQTCEFVEATSLIPEGWDVWFWELISTDAPFSWGDNNRTLVTAERFADHCKSVITDEVSPEDKQAFLDKLARLGETYVDLEN